MNWLDFSAIAGVAALIYFVAWLRSRASKSTTFEGVLGRATKGNAPSDILVQIVLQKIAMRPEDIEADDRGLSWRSGDRKIRLTVGYFPHLDLLILRGSSLRVGTEELQLSGKQWKALCVGVRALKKIADDKRAADKAARDEHAALDAVISLLDIETGDTPRDATS